MHAQNFPIGAIATGLSTIADDGRVLDAWFPTPRLRTDIRQSQTRRLPDQEVAGARRDVRRAASVIAIRTEIADLTEPPQDIADIYLRLHLISHRLIRPRETNLEGMIAMLPRVAWTSLGPCLPGEVENIRRMARSNGFDFHVRSVFPLPRMTDYVIPADVAIAIADNVVLGAYLAPGTMVAPSGFCAFNAGTLGRAMVEGRISAGVVVGEGTDIGGGASLMGTLSGGGRQIITVGRNCLLGANSGIGISLGDNCVVEAGCYITAGVPVTWQTDRIVKAVQLSGRSNLLFRRNSINGRLEAIDQTKGWCGLNPLLHSTSNAETQPQLDRGRVSLPSCL